MFGITFSFSPDLGRKLIQAVPPVQATKRGGSDLAPWAAIRASCSRKILPCPSLSSIETATPAVSHPSGPGTAVQISFRQSCGTSDWREVQALQDVGGVEASRTALLSQEGSTIETAVE